MLKLKEYMTIILLVRIWLHIIWSFVSIKNKQSKILNLHKNRIETTRNERSCKILQNQFVNPVNPFVSYLKDQKLPHSNESKSQFYRKKLLEIGCKSKYNENKYGSTDIHDLTTEIDDPKNSNLNILNEPRFFYSNSTKLAYCELTKCASTNWKQTMIIIELYHRYLKISKDLDNFNITKEEGFNFLHGTLRIPTASSAGSSDSKKSSSLRKFSNYKDGDKYRRIKWKRSVERLDVKKKLLNLHVGLPELDQLLSQMDQIAAHKPAEFKSYIEKHLSDQNLKGFFRADRYRESVSYFDKTLGASSNIKSIYNRYRSYLVDNSIYYKFLFVRHPLERLLSAYRDKFQPLIIRKIAMDNGTKIDIMSEAMKLKIDDFRELDRYKFNYFILYILNKPPNYRSAPHDGKIIFAGPKPRHLVLGGFFFWEGSFIFRSLL